MPDSTELWQILPRETNLRFYFGIPLDRSGGRAAEPLFSGGIWPRELLGSSRAILSYLHFVFSTPHAAIFKCPFGGIDLVAWVDLCAAGFSGNLGHTFLLEQESDLGRGGLACGYRR